MPSTPGMRRVVRRGRMREVPTMRENSAEPLRYMAYLDLDDARDDTGHSPSPPASIVFDQAENRPHTDEVVPVAIPED